MDGTVMPPLPGPWPAGRLACWPGGELRQPGLPCAPQWIPGAPALAPSPPSRGPALLCSASTSSISSPASSLFHSSRLCPPIHFRLGMAPLPLCCPLSRLAQLSADLSFSPSGSDGRVSEAQGPPLPTARCPTVSSRAALPRWAPSAPAPQPRQHKLAAEDPGLLRRTCQARLTLSVSCVPRGRRAAGPGGGPVPSPGQGHLTSLNPPI